MFISKEQLEQRLNSSRNIINIIKPQSTDKPLSPSEVSVPNQVHPPIEENLPGENNKQRAARVARNSIDLHESHGEYTVNPNIDNDIVRTTIGILAESSSSQEIQKEFGVTKNQIVGAKNSKKKGIQARIEHGRNRVSELALDTLLETLGLLDPVALIGQKPKDIASIAASLAKVVSSVKNQDKDKNSDTNVNVVVYAPEKRELSSYSVVDV